MQSLTFILLSNQALGLLKQDTNEVCMSTGCVVNAFLVPFNTVDGHNEFWGRMKKNVDMDLLDHAELWMIIGEMI